MNAFNRFRAALSARNKEFIRDKSALGWNILFPVLVIAGFAVAFDGKNQDVLKVGIAGDRAATQAAVPAFLEAKYVSFVGEPTSEAGLKLLRRHQIDLLLEGKRYWINESSPKGYLAEKVLLATSQGLERQTVDGKEIRYVDWLVSGLLAMNMMFSALFGVGYVIVRYRKNGVLKRLKATPLRSFEFLTAQVVSRMILLTAVNVVVFVGCNYFIKFRMEGSYWDLLLIMSMGAICLISMGLLIAARGSSEEFAGGLLNLVSWPMMFLSGVWFSLEGAHPMVRAFAKIFPLTHVIDGARAIMTEGATLAQVSGNLVVLAAMSLAFLAIGALAFKWE